MSQKRSVDEISDFKPSQFNKKSRLSKNLQQNTNPVDANGLSECFKEVKTSLYVSLAPLYLNSPTKGIKAQHLDPLLMKFSSKLRGVVLGYSDVTIINDNHDKDEENTLILSKVNAHTPFAFLWVHVTFLIWRPKVGDVVEGLVYMQSPSHIGLLVHDTFNASIKKFNIPEDWTFIPNQEDEKDEENAEGEQETNSRTRNNILGQWVDANEIPIDGKLKVTIKAIRTGSRVLSLEATLIRPEQESSSLPVVPGGKKIKFDDFEPVEPVTKTETETIPGYEESSEEEEVVAEEDSSEDDDSGSD